MRSVGPSSPSGRQSPAAARSRTVTRSFSASPAGVRAAVPAAWVLSLTRTRSTGMAVRAGMLPDANRALAAVR